MSTDQWLPNGADLGTDFKLRSLLQSGDGWQIFRTKGRSLVLVVEAALVDWWCSLALIEKDLFSALSIGGKDFFYLSSGADATIEPVSAGGGPQTKADASASLMHGRKPESAFQMDRCKTPCLLNDILVCCL